MTKVAKMAATAATSTNNLLDHAKNNFRDFKNCRGKEVELVSSIVNLINKKTYFTAEKVQSAVGSAVKPSAIAFALDNKLFDLFAQLDSLQRQLTESLSLLSDIAASAGADAESSPLDGSNLQNVVEQMRQQLLLEKSLASSLVSHSDRSDQDGLLTLLACFQLSPYLRMADIDRILAI